MIVIRIEGVSDATCSKAWYLGDVTLFLWGLIIGAILVFAITVRWRAILPSASTLGHCTGYAIGTILFSPVFIFRAVRKVISNG